MAVFPVFSQGFVSASGYAERYTKGGDLVSQTSSGYNITRRQFTRRPKTFTVPYKGLLLTDKDLMDAFVLEQGIVGNFSWTHPVTAVVHDVRMLDIPDITQDGVNWKFTVKLGEV